MLKNQQSYSNIWHSLLGNYILILALFSAIFPYGSIISLILLLLLIWKKQIPDAFVGITLITLGNPAIFNTDFINLSRWIIIISGLVVAWPGLRARSIAIFYFISLLGAYLVWSSFSISDLALLSLFKGLLFIATLWILLNSGRIDWKLFSLRMETFIPFYVLINIPIYFFPAGFLRNGLGFQGLTNQPQVLGVLCALFAVWISIRLFSSDGVLSRNLTILTITILIFFVFLSQSRTGLGSAVAGILISYITMIFKIKRNLVRNLITAFFALVIAGGLYYGTNTIQDFVFKERIGGIRDTDISSRNDLANLSLENWREHPLLGIGFGVPSTTDDANFVFDPIFNLPLSVSAEKGVWVTAVLEEIGIIGFVILCLFLIVLFMYSIRMGRYSATFILAFILVSNLGEQTMFSIGAFGMISWVMFFAELNSRDGLGERNDSKNYLRYYRLGVQRSTN